MKINIKFKQKIVIDSFIIFDFSLFFSFIILEKININIKKVNMLVIVHILIMFISVNKQIK